MEVRVEKHKKNHLPIIHIDRKLSLRILLASVAVCLLAGFFVWRFGGKEAQAGYVMEKDAQGRYIFNVVEVVPKKNQAVLGLMIDGAENISKERLKEFANGGDYANKQYRKYPDVFYWEDETTGEKNTSGNGITAPFTLILQNREVKEIINNEIFKLYMMEGIKYDSNKTVYENYKSNKKSLDAINKTYSVKYQFVTPGELEKMDRKKIQYLQIGGGTQASESYNQLYDAIIGGTNIWEDSYKETSNDISFQTAMELYNRALSDDNKLSLSISGYCMQSANRATNMYKLYQMLNYFDAPRLFENLFSGKLYATIQGYIDADTGNIWYTWGSPLVKEEINWNMLPDFAGIINLSSHGVKYEPAIDTARPGNYIPDSCQNVLLYQNLGGRWYFGNITSHAPVNTIIELSPADPGDVPEDDDEGTVKVLEIEPCNSYWLDEGKQGNRKKLAQALSVDESDINITYVTPNRLNGMAVDLVAEYDVIFIGDDVSHFRGGSDAKKYIYRNNGGENDRIVPQTLLNGLLTSDYSTVEEFNALIKPESLSGGSTLASIGGENAGFWNPGLRKKWDKTGNAFLKNVELSLQLSGKLDNPVSMARFSGNDLNRYMQAQLAEFVKSGQPVIVAKKVQESAQEQLLDFDEKDWAEGTVPKQDARLYFGLMGIEDERLYYDKNQTLPNETYTNISTIESLPDKVERKTSFKPIIKVENLTNMEGEAVSTIMEIGDTALSLGALTKSNRLTFAYTITLPADTKASDCEMKVILDRNGDGAFDAEGAGKTQVGSGFGTQNNATTDTIKNDKVYSWDLGTGGAGETVTGTFAISDASVDVSEEFCAFRVVVSPKVKDNRLRGIWTGYMRSELDEKRDVRILQITPFYADTQEKVKGLAGNEQFKELLSDVQTGSEFNLDLDHMGEGIYETISEQNFASGCTDGTISAKTLADKASGYDLIIVGTDFNPESVTVGTDIDQLSGIQVLKEYMEVQKRPIIFTNDSISYVNSYNYVTPVKKEAAYRNMTIAEGKEAKENGYLDQESQKYRKVQIGKEEYDVFKQKNESLGTEGEGTTYLEGGGSEAEETVFKALVRPFSMDQYPPVGPADLSRNTRERYLGYDNVVNDVGRPVDVTATVDGWDADGWSDFSGDNFQVLEETRRPRLLRASRYQNILNTSMGSLLYPTVYTKNGETSFFYTTLGYVKRAEVEQWYQDQGSGSYEGARIRYEKDWYGINFETYRIRDVHAAINEDEIIDESWLVSKNPISILEDTYYEFYPDGDKSKGPYLAIADKAPDAGYMVWQILDDGYKLTDVAGTPTALYPNKNNWNYLVNQYFRYPLGMDRFSVTQEVEDKDRVKLRDPGTARRKYKVEELQGFTNGTLLEYAHLLSAGSPWSNKVNKHSIYQDNKLALGTAPRTNRAERLNNGIICQYPYQIQSDPNNTSDLTIEIVQNHAPYYQMDLNRELGEGKIDDVTVWYTLAGAAASDTQTQKDAAAYFNVTRRDAGNNYYLFSKGKAYYTGFSIPNQADAKVPETEMKLFINTIYAALIGKQTDAAAEKPYEAVLKPIGTVSTISRATMPGANNQYVCYYDEYDEALTFQFRIQKPGAVPDEKTPALLGLKKAGEGFVLDSRLTEQQYKLPDGIELKAIPVAVSPDNNSENGLLQGPGSWYELSIPFGESMLSKNALDGQTLVLAVAVQDITTGADAINGGAIHAEIRLIMRDSFDLD